MLTLRPKRVIEILNRDAEYYEDWGIRAHKEATRCLVKRYSRECLRCQEEFRAHGKYNRICYKCKINQATDIIPHSSTKRPPPIVL